MLKIIFLFSLFISSFAFGSAQVCIKGNKLEVHSNLVFYGQEVNNQAGADCAQEIKNLFSASDLTLDVGEKKLKLEFKISYQNLNQKQALKHEKKSKGVIDNYIRIGKKASNEKDGRSNHILGGNCGFYAKNDNLGSSTTCTHEYAHGLGLDHYDQRKNHYGSNGDLRKQGQPGIMAARGFWVHKKYQHNSKARPGEYGGTINPVYRKVLESDIEDLKLETLNFDKNGCADLGRRSGYLYNEEGDAIILRRWIGTKAFKKISDLLSGVSKDQSGLCRNN